MSLHKSKSIFAIIMLSFAMFSAGCDASDPTSDDQRVDKIAERLALLESEIEAVNAAPTQQPSPATRVEPEPLTPRVTQDEDSITAPSPELPPLFAQDDAPSLDSEPSSLHVLKASIAKDVSERSPHGVADTFTTADSTIWAWARVKNDGERESQITMVWRHEGKRKSTVTLKVGVSHGWRTWSRKRIHPSDTGAWSVDIFNPEGDLLSTSNFTITTASTAQAEVFEGGCSL